jgi:hypothetical protein
MSPLASFGHWADLDDAAADSCPFRTNEPAAKKGGLQKNGLATCRGNPEDTVPVLGCRFPDPPKLEITGSLRRFDVDKHRYVVTVTTHFEARSSGSQKRDQTV